MKTNNLLNNYSPMFCAKIHVLITIFFKNTSNLLYFTIFLYIFIYATFYKTKCTSKNKMYAHIYNYHISNILSITRSNEVKSSLNYIVETNKLILDSWLEICNENRKLKRQLKKAKENNEFLQEQLNKYRQRCDYGESSDKEKIYELTEENDSLKVELEELHFLKESLQDEKIDLESISNLVFPINESIVIDAKNKLSDENKRKNDCYNKLVIFKAFEFEIFNNNSWVIQEQKFNRIEGKSPGKKLFIHEFSRYVIKTISATHQLITTTKLFQSWVGNLDVVRMFTFIEYNEIYPTKHLKNFNFNSDQVAAVLMPYIWEQIPTEDQITIKNVMKIVVIYKFNDEGIIADEFRFMIIYRNKFGDYKYYIVDEDIRFTTNVKFNFIEQNLYCNSLSDLTKQEDYFAQKEIIRQSLKDNLEQAFNNRVEQESICHWENNKLKVEHRFDFNMNKIINSSNVHKLFTELKSYCRFEIKNKSEIKRVINNQLFRMDNPEYNEKVLNHYVSDFTYEEFDKLDLELLAKEIKPDTVVVSY